MTCRDGEPSREAMRLALCPDPFELDQDVSQFLVSGVAIATQPGLAQWERCRDDPTTWRRSVPRNVESPACHPSWGAGLNVIRESAASRCLPSFCLAP